MVKAAAKRAAVDHAIGLGSDFVKSNLRSSFPSVLSSLSSFSASLSDKDNTDSVTAADSPDEDGDSDGNSSVYTYATEGGLGGPSLVVETAKMPNEKPLRRSLSLGRLSGGLSQGNAGKDGVASAGNAVAMMVV